MNSAISTQPEIVGWSIDAPVALESK